MGLGRHLVDDENSIYVQNARRVQLTDDVSISCKTSEDAELLRAHLADLQPKPTYDAGALDAGAVALAVNATGEDEPVIPVKRGPGRPRKVQD